MSISMKDLITDTRKRITRTAPEFLDTLRVYVGPQFSDRPDCIPETRDVAGGRVRAFR
jgi:hypothetical protein